MSATVSFFYSNFCNLKQLPTVDRAICFAGAYDDASQADMEVRNPIAVIPINLYMVF